MPYREVETGPNEDYQDNSEIIIPQAGLPRLDFPLDGVHGDTVSVSTRLRPGMLAATNIAAGSYLVNVAGAKPVGLDSEGDDMVLAVGSERGSPSTDHASPTGSTTITVSTGHSLPIVLGRALTLVAIAILALELLVVPACRALSRRFRTAGEA